MKIEKLIKIYNISGKIQLLSGLHIGMGNQEIHIGGIDNPVIKHPISNEPYIPGSSIKGKMRTLLEYHLGKVTKGPFSPVQKGLSDAENQKLVEKDVISRIFGSSETKYSAGPTRLTVRDAFVVGEYREKLDDNKDFTTFELYEAKYETAIDRQSGTAARGTLRQTERVIPGVEFGLEIIYKVFDHEDDANLEKVKVALKLLESDSLGGSGSRGYGRIKINELKISPVEV